MKRILFPILALFLLAACAKQTSSPTEPEETLHVAPETEESVQTSGTQASIMVYDMTHGEWVIHNADRAETAFLPDSTFTIPLTLIGLQAGVLEKDEVFKWDGKNRGYEPWNRDLTLEEAFRWSAIWVFRIIADRIGHERMQNYMDLMEYGNTNLAGKSNSFWLDGKLRITSRQQVEFLIRLYMNNLPFSKENMDFVKKIMIRDSGEGWLMRAKSGWAQWVKPQFGWMVGWIEKGDEVAFFATNVKIDRREDAELRMGYTKAVMQELGVIGKDE